VKRLLLLISRGKQQLLSRKSLTAREALGKRAVGLCKPGRLLRDGMVAVPLREFDGLAASIAEVVQFGSSGFAASDGLDVEYVG